MAIRDRITITTKTGQTEEVVATKMGSTVRVDKGRDWVIAQAEASDKARTVLKEVTVAAGEVVAIVRDQQPATARVRRSKEKS